MATTVYWLVINIVVGVGQLTESWLIDLLARWLLPVAIVALCLGLGGLRQAPAVMKRVHSRRWDRAATVPRVPWPYDKREPTAAVDPTPELESTIERPDA